MRKKILFGILIAAIMLPVSAELTVSEIASPEYLINHGHSIAGAEAVARSKSAALGIPYESIREERFYESNPFWGFLREVYTYLDPAPDQNTFLNHDIKVEPSYTDL